MRPSPASLKTKPEAPRLLIRLGIKFAWNTIAFAPSRFLKPLRPGDAITLRSPFVGTQPIRRKDPFSTGVSTLTQAAGRMHHGPHYPCPRADVIHAMYYAHGVSQQPAVACAIRF